MRCAAGRVEAGSAQLSSALHLAAPQCPLPVCACAALSAHCLRRCVLLQCAVCGAVRCVACGSSRLSRQQSRATATHAAANGRGQEAIWERSQRHYQQQPEADTTHTDTCNDALSKSVVRFDITPLPAPSFDPVTRLILHRWRCLYRPSIERICDISSITLMCAYCLFLFFLSSACVRFLLR